MGESWQTPAALAVVALTALAFVVRFWRKRKSKGRAGCGSGCNCPASPRGPHITSGR